MVEDQQHVWVVCSEAGSLLLPVASKQAAEVYKEAGWQVTELPLSAFSAEEMRCLGIRRLPPETHQS